MVGELATGDGQELPLVAVRPEDEAKDAVAGRVADLAVGHRVIEGAKRCAPGPHDERTDPRGVVARAGRVLGGEHLVVVVMAADHDVRVVLEQGSPERVEARVAAVLAGAEPRMVPDSHRAAGAILPEVVDEPPGLLRIRAAAAHAFAVGVEDQDVPRAHGRAVPGPAIRPRRRSEIIDVARRAGGLPVMVPGDWQRPRAVASPRGAVAVAELGRAATLVGVVARREDRARDGVEQPRRRIVRVAVTAADVAGADQDRRLAGNQDRLDRTSRPEWCPAGQPWSDCRRDEDGHDHGEDPRGQDEGDRSSEWAHRLKASRGPRPACFAPGCWHGDVSRRVAQRAAIPGRRRPREGRREWDDGAPRGGCSDRPSSATR